MAFVRRRSVAPDRLPSQRAEKRRTADSGGGTRSESGHSVHPSIISVIPGCRSSHWDSNSKAVVVCVKERSAM